MKSGGVFAALIALLIVIAVSLLQCKRYEDAPDLIPLLYDTSIFVPQTYAEKPVLYQKPLSPETSLLYMHVADGFRVELFAAEPDVVNPVAMNWDERGRLWVIEAPDYPHREAGQYSRIKILEDTNRDGKADKVKVFADSLNIATGLAFSNGGVIVAQAPDLLFLRDTNNDDRADERKVLVSGWGTYDTHAGPSNLKYGFDNKIWGAVGYSGFMGDGEYADERFGQGIFRMNPNGRGLESYAQFSNNTWGLGFSEDFKVFGSTANNMHAVHVAIPLPLYNASPTLYYGGAINISSHFEVHTLVKNLRQVDFRGGFTAAAGFSVYTARSFPEAYWNKIAFVCEPTAGVVHQVILEEQGATFTEKDGLNILASPDEWFSPVHAEVGPDGALWVADWYSFIIQHNPTPKGFKTGEGNAYVTPLRDNRHGRIYRIIHEDSQNSKYPTLDQNKPKGLLEALNHPNLFWRLHAQRLLVERGKLDVVPKLLKIVDRVHKEKPHLAIHALWTLHGLNGFENISDRHREMIFGLMSHSNPSIQRTALLIAPEDEKTARRILDYSLLDSPDLPIRLQAILKSCRLPGSPELIEALLSTGLKPENQNDTVFAAAICLALKYHSEILRAEQYEAKAGELRGVQAGWHLPAFDPKRWQTIKTGLPFEAQEIAELKDFNGLIWYRTDIYLTEAPADEKITLHLGPVDNSDVTWINGVQVGSTIERWDMPRVYTLPAGLLKKGKNSIAIQVDDPRDVGGLTGKDIFFQAGHKKIPIPVEWRYAIEKRYASYYDPSKDLLGLLEKINQQGKALEAGDKVAVFILLKTKPGKMQFDRDTIRAPAGKRIEIIFVNDDNMPHNLVVGKPGTLSEIGLASEKITGQTTFVPVIEAVLFALPLVLQGERKTLSFIAPTVPGDYVLVCTYPGHWRVMNGVLSVR